MRKLDSKGVWAMSSHCLLHKELNLFVNSRRNKALDSYIKENL